jgi:hypothetical protein
MSVKALVVISGVLGCILLVLLAMVFYTEVLVKKNSDQTAEVNNTPNSETKNLSDGSIPPPPSTHTVEIVNCKLAPETVSTKLNEFVTVKNLDQSEHLIKVDEEHLYTIPANGSGYILMNFGNAAGKFPFTCDNVSSGVFEVGENEGLPTATPGPLPTYY